MTRTRRGLTRLMLAGVGGLVFTSLAAAAIWPDQVGNFTRKPVNLLSVEDRPLYDEFGLEASEQAEYANGASRFKATAWRLKDSTSALALFEARRPSGAKPAKLATRSVTTDDGVVLLYGNYVLQFTGHVPTTAELNPALLALPQLQQSPLPPLMAYLPPDGLIPNSERYILGPVSLERFEPRIAPSLAAFRLGAEAQLGKYHTDRGDLGLIIFSYPTPSMARERAEEFGKLQGSIVKRTGSMVAVVLPPADPDAAERLLAKVEHKMAITLNETPKGYKAKGFLGMVGNAIIFSGIMMGFCLVVGVALGGLTALRRQFGKKAAQQEMITLGLDGK